MDSTNTASTEASTTSTAPVTTGASNAQTTTPSVPAAAPSSATPAQSAGSVDTAGTEAPAAAYSPNIKFKVMDKEHEFDEWIRPHIKDAETEKKVKELYEKAYGLDFVKPKYETSQKQLEQYQQSYHSLYNDAAEALTFKNNGDLDAFFDKVALKPGKVYEWVLEKINRQNLPPDQRRVYDELDAKKRSEYQQSRQIGESEQKYQQIATQAREAEVNYVLARPDISQIMQNYDARNGQGSFKQYVAEHGVMHFNAYGEDPSAEQAVSAVLKRLGDGYKSQPALQSAPTANGEKPLPVIPNVSGKNVSPTRKSPRSIDDIRKFAAEVRE